MYFRPPAFLFIIISAIMRKMMRIMQLLDSVFVPFSHPSLDPPVIRRENCELRIKISDPIRMSMNFPSFRSIFSCLSLYSRTALLSFLRIWIWWRCLLTLFVQRHFCDPLFLPHLHEGFWFSFLRSFCRWGEDGYMSHSLSLFLWMHHPSLMWTSWSVPSLRSDEMWCRSMVMTCRKRCELRRRERNTGLTSVFRTYWPHLAETQTPSVTCVGRQLRSSNSEWVIGNDFKAWKW